MTFDAFWLPGISSPGSVSRSYGIGTESSLELRFARLRPDELALQISALVSAREETLIRRPVAGIASSIGRVAERFLDRRDPVRIQAEELLEPVTGLSAPMVRLILDRMAADWTVERLQQLLSVEFGDCRVLDDFIDRAGTGERTHAIGPRLAVHIFSGNVPGISVTSLIRTLLLKAATLGKTASGEPVLAPLFARAIAEEDEALGRCLAVTYWPGGDPEMEGRALGQADTVIAYGSTAAVEGIRARLSTHTRFVAYGNRVSFAAVARESLSKASAAEVARSAALAIATFDQQGCVSPHLVFAERGGELNPKRWAALVADELALLEQTLPRGVVSSAESSAILQLRGEAEVAELAGGGAALYASKGGTGWTVLFEPEPRFRPSCLNRTVSVVAVDRLEQIPALAAPLGAALQSVGIAGPEHRMRPLALELARLGVSRVAPLSGMAWPPPWWHHDGRPPLTELVRWCDWE